MRQEALDLLEKLLGIPSVNSVDQEKKVAEYIAAYFQDHGIKAELQYIDEAHANVMAFLPGKDTKRTMIWNGHLDTVPYGNLEEWKTDPSAATELEGKVYARGASDMKSGLAAMVYALCNTSEIPAYNIQFLGTCDEEKNGLGASEILRKKCMEQAEWLLIGEPTGMQLGIAQKGCLWLEIKVKGKTSHGAYPKEGVNAIHYGICLAKRLETYISTYSFGILGSSTAQITMIEGGVALNMTADECCVKMDIRMVPGLTKEKVLDFAGKILQEEQKITPGLEAEFNVLNDRRAIKIDSQHPMTLALRKILRSYGYEGNDIGLNFFTDASILDRYDKKQILLFGPGEPSMAHKPNEYVDIKKYTDAIHILMEFMQECMI